MKKSHSATNLFGLKIFSKGKTDLLNILETHLKKGKKLISIFTPNPEQVVLAKNDRNFAKTLGFADILIPDGAGLVIASKIFNFFKLNDREGELAERVAERITGVDLTRDLLQLAKENRLKVLVVGGKDYLGYEYEDWVVQDFSSGVRKSGLGGAENKVSKNVIYWTEGFADVNNRTKGEEKTVVSAISMVKPDMIFVAFGAPNQEEWVVQNSELLKKNGVLLAMVVGGSFDFLFGKVFRAPEWMQKTGLEWFYRLLKQPWRWHRQLRLVGFLWFVFLELVGQQEN